MDVLEKYKKSWKNQPEETHKVSKVAIYKMAHKKSSSIVKWIFIIGIAEFLLWMVLSFFLKTDNYQKVISTYHLETFITYSYLVHYTVIIVFLFLFYKNYMSISASENTKQLIRKIIKTRTVVKNYVMYNIIGYIVLSIILNLYFYHDLELFKSLFLKGITLKNEKMFWIIMIVAQIVALVLMTTLLWLLYQLIYGRLIKKLTHNYKELTKLDELNFLK